MEFNHISVLLSECMDGLNIRPDGIYVDGTTGGGGHSLEIAKRLKDGKLYCLDKDPDAIQAASERLKVFPGVKFIQADYRNMKEVLRLEGIYSIDGCLLDLGVSSHQLDTAERGFSYHMEAPLDMRMSQEGTTAEDIVNTWDGAALTKILFEYGEEKYARTISAAIIEARSSERIRTTSQLADIIREAVPAKVRREKNPARKTFQALRIAINGELENLRPSLEDGFEVLNPGGRLAVITFHSLEDRIVKKTFSDFTVGCTCPPDFPICVCGKKPRGELISRKPILPTAEELTENRRSRSAKLRIIKKL